MNGDDVTDEDGEPSKTKRCLSKRRAGIIRALNRPETRDSGVMIFNWARYTAQKLGNRFGDLKLNTNHYTSLKIQPFTSHHSQSIQPSSPTSPFSHSFSIFIL